MLEQRNLSHHLVSGDPRRLGTGGHMHDPALESAVDLGELEDVVAVCVGLPVGIDYYGDVIGGAFGLTNL